MRVHWFQSVVITKCLHEPLFVHLRFSYCSNIYFSQVAVMWTKIAKMCNQNISYDQKITVIVSFQQSEIRIWLDPVVLSGMDSGHESVTQLLQICSISHSHLSKHLSKICMPFKGAVQTPDGTTIFKKNVHTVQRLKKQPKAVISAIKSKRQVKR